MARRHAAQALVITLIGGLASAVSGSAAGTAPEPAGDVVQLHADGDGVSAATISLASNGKLAARRTTASVETIETSGFSQVAVTWRGGGGDVAVQTRADGVWSEWRDLEQIHDAPDPGTEGNGLTGSDLLWVGDSDAVRLRVDGATPRDLALVLQQPSRHAGSTTYARVTDAQNSSATVKRAAKPTTTGVPRPNLFTRKQWGANNKWRNGTPTYTSNLKQVHIHHTATANGYTKAEVPGVIQGMYRYHTKTLGWFDLGYNFVIDRFGRTWKGRSGGAGKLVRGAHTLGFNEGSTGIAVLGNHETKKVSKKAITAIVRLAAWKLDRHDAPKARGKVRVVSAGSDRFRAGRVVRLPAIDGHRDTNQTACPGARLYDRLGEIRKRTQRRIDRLGS